MNPSDSPAKSVATAFPTSNTPETGIGQGVCACGCGGLLKRKGQKYYSDRCRLVAYRRREAARIADEVRAEVYEILIRKLEKGGTMRLITIESCEDGCIFYRDPVDPEDKKGRCARNKEYRMLESLDPNENGCGLPKYEKDR